MTYEDALDVLLSLGKEHGFDPELPEGMEEYFRGLVTRFQGPTREFRTWIASEVSKAFRCYKSRPKWLQGAEWPVEGGSPMVFVGQLDVPWAADGSRGNSDRAFFVFLDEATGATKVVVQYD